ncbi:Maf family protein [Cobetia sp. L2A1]|uniref:Maf family protein n=1 Tax=Cobetia sp. L2A1 TaxID=2686360 RepID=UPI00131CF4D4|nr:Maf family protein [Cobetia sp. L2A1]
MSHDVPVPSLGAGLSSHSRSSVSAEASSSSPPLILASGSPRRRDLLASIGVPCVVAPADIDESPWVGESPEHYVLRMAREKAQAGYRAQLDWRGSHARSPTGIVVLGADTALALEGRILGKPRDEADAREMLLGLSGRSHQVLSGIALCYGPLVGEHMEEGGGSAKGEEGSLQMHCEAELVESRVTFRTITPEEVARYWATGEPADKAGGYAIQGLGAVFVSHLQGSYSAVVGLPLHETSRMLMAQGIGCWQD